MANNQQQDSAPTTRILLNFVCGHYRLWKVSPKGAAYLQSIYVQNGATVEEGIVLADQQSCYACRWPVILKRFYLLPEWKHHDSAFPGNDAEGKKKTDTETKGQAEEMSRALRAHMASSIIALFIQHPILPEDRLAVLLCLWDRACVELGAKFDFDFGRLADEVYEVIITLTSAEEKDGGDEEVATFLRAGQDMDVGKVVAKIQEELKPGGAAEKALKQAAAATPHPGPDARGVEGMIYRGQMLEKRAAPSPAAPRQSQQDGEKKEAPRRGIRARLVASLKKR
ncbi:hypothetical protein PGQ11_010078 [Apiospora arundinis]|uniref:Uncharacterized protein n=1 Tax=Apiospora arundinis TaxID=335852 RepID=A0ABR2I8L8_9PEZI